MFENTLCLHSSSVTSWGVGNSKKHQPIKGEWLGKSIPKLPEQSSATFDSQLVHQQRVIRGSVQLCIANDVVTEIATKHASIDHQTLMLAHSRRNRPVPAYNIAKDIFWLSLHHTMLLSMTVCDPLQDAIFSCV